jgi:hypothetical protein
VCVVEEPSDKLTTQKWSQWQQHLANGIVALVVTFLGSHIASHISYGNPAQILALKRM